MHFDALCGNRGRGGGIAANLGDFLPILIRSSCSGVGLMPKEVVSPQVVANWFANKRKELRRRSQEASEQAAAVAGPATSQPTTPAHPANEEATVGDFFWISGFCTP